MFGHNTAKWGRSLFSFAVCLFVTASLLATPDFYVNPQSVGFGNGSSWSSAATLDFALANASDGDEIWLAAGIYTNTGDSAFTVADNVTIYGGFTNGMGSIGERDIDAHAAHLDGGYHENGTNFPLRRILMVTDSCTLDGVIITNGTANVGSGTSHGSGIFRNGLFTLNIFNCKIVDCHMVDQSWGPKGAALYLGLGTTVISNSLIARNGDIVVTHRGGGREGQAIFCTGEQLTLRDCVVRDNMPVSAFESRSNEGGAIHAEGASGSLTVEDCTFINNRTPDISSATRDGGGAICIQGPDAIIRRCLFRGNKATFDNNNYDASGGAIEVESSSSDVVIEHCLFEDNIAGIRTGGTSIQESYGGAFFMDAGNVTISNCTFVGNHSRYDGGAIGLTGGNLDIINCILYTNSSGARGSDVTLLGGTLTVSYTRLGGTGEPTFIYDEAGGVTLMNVFTNDPLFADSDGGDYHLRSPAGRYDTNTMAFVTTDAAPYSPCIDAGDRSTPVGAETVENGSRINLGRYGGTTEASRSPNLAPEIQNGGSNVNINVVDVQGQLVNNDTIAECTVYFSTLNPPTKADASATVYPPQQIGTIFEAQISGLLFDTTYYYRWYATNAYGEDWADTVSSFVTGAEPPGGGSDIIHVDADATGGEDGLNWFNAFTSVADAMAAVNANTNTLWVADGTYNDAEITVSTACTILGGFDGSETNISERDVAGNPPVLLDGAGIRRVMTVSADCTVGGLVITNGNSTGGGSGIKKNGAYTLTIDDCTVTDCKFNTANTGPDGAGLYLASGTTIITNSTIRDNGDSCFGYCGGGRVGQGIFCNNENLTFRNSTLLRNRPRDTHSSRGSEGGGLHAVGSGTLIFEDSTFKENETPNINASFREGGGAICIQGPDAQIRRCLFEGNIAGKGRYDYDHSGGAIEVDHSSSEVLIEYCLFEYNDAGKRNGSIEAVETYGGALFVNAGYVSVSNCNFVGNHSEFYGGAIGIEGGTLDVTHCIFYTNAISSAKGIAGMNIVALGGTLNIMYCVMDGTSEPGYIFDQNNDVTLMNVATADPMFHNSNARDYHLRSPSGRYNPGTMSFVTTDASPYSPAIDAGDHGVGVGAETVENGNRVNVGYYGGTAQASRSPSLAPEVENRSNTVVVNVVTVRGEMVNNDTIADCRVYYSDANNPPIPGVDPFVTVYPPQQIGSEFEATLSGLDFSTTYYYQWCASNFYGEDCANSASNFITGAAPASGGPHIIHVKEDAIGSGDGTSWFSAFTSLGDAVAVVNNPNTNEIWVAAGHYDDTTVIITQDVCIYGGFAGTETSLSQRSVVTNGRPGLDGGAVRRVMEITGGTVKLDGIAVSNGVPTGGNTTGIGIRISGTSTDVSINDCVIRNNQYGSGSSLASSGYGLYNSGASIAITNSLIADNGYPSGGYQGVHFGMGIHQTGSGASLRLMDCVLENNTGDSWGTRNSSGGAIWANGGTIYAENCEFIDNRIGDGNSDPLDGGGCAKLLGGTHRFVNCAFSGNRVWKFSVTGYGGCFNIQGGSTEVYLQNCSVVDSYALDRGAAFYVASGSLFMTNCILWSNQVDAITSHPGAEGRDIANVGGYVEVAYCNLSGPNTDANFLYNDSTLLKGSGLINVNPLFAGDFGDLHLKSEGGRYDPSTKAFTNDTVTSLCIDAGAPGGLSTYTNETTPNGERVNLGAYGNTPEASRTPPAVPPLVTNRAATVTNNYATLRGELVVNDATADIFIYYGIGDSGESFAGWIGFLQPTPAQQSTGSVFAASIGGLAYNTTYTFRCFATNAAGFHWSQNPLTFTTGSEPPGGPDGVIHVRSGALGSQNGETWFDAAHSLAAGLALVNGPTNEIWVANRFESAVSTVTIETNVNVYGGFIGDPVAGETLRTQRALTNATVLDGNYLVRIIDITAGSVVLDGLTLTNGFSGQNTVGHGVRANGHDSITIANCFIQNNGLHDNCDGAGAYIIGGSAYITNSVFDGNGRGHNTQGGAIYASGVMLTIADSLFIDNHNYGAAAGRQSHGGAIYLAGGATLDATRCDFIDNKVGDQSLASHGGGCAYINGSAANFLNCVFRGNGNDAGTTWNGPNGGVFYITGGSSVTVVNCTMAYNEGLSTTNGGMAYINSSYFGAKNCIFWENTASTLIDSRGDEFYLTGTAVLDIRWSDISGTNPNEVVISGSNATFAVDENVISTDPLFVSATDLHLKSQGGRYDDATQQFVGTDSETSICIDFGDPADDVGEEPEPNGGVINLGAYGGTRFASRTNTKRGSILEFQ